MSKVNKVKKLREKAGLRREELASQSGVSFSALCRLERGDSPNAYYVTLAKLAKALKCEVEELL